MDYTHYMGWDVGGWNCDDNPNSRDAIVCLDASSGRLIGSWRGNLRGLINDSGSARDFFTKMLKIVEADSDANDVKVVLSIDAPLGFSSDLVRLLSGYKEMEKISGNSFENPYLFRETERFLRKHGGKPLSAIKDMIGSQATKAMHVLRKFAFRQESCGVWHCDQSFTIIETYPAICEKSNKIKKLRKEHGNRPWAECGNEKEKQDKEDALTCALVAGMFDQQQEEFAAPQESTPEEEGWIWVPVDALKEQD